MLGLTLKIRQVNRAFPLMHNFDAMHQNLECSVQAAFVTRPLTLWRTVAGICSTRILESFLVVT
jgi:hypothetical protein